MGCSYIFGICRASSVKPILHMRLVPRKESKKLYTDSEYESFHDFSILWRLRVMKIGRKPYRYFPDYKREIN